MQIEDDDTQCRRCCCCGCFQYCRSSTTNPDFKRPKLKPGAFIKEPYLEIGYLIPAHKKPGTGKTLEMLRRECLATRGLSSPAEAIVRNNRKADSGNSGLVMEMDVSDVNNLLRRRLSLRVLVPEEDLSGERGEALLPQKTNLTEAAPILLSHLVKGSDARRSSVRHDAIDRIRSSFSISRASRDSLMFQPGHIGNDPNLTQKSDPEFIAHLVKTSQFIREALEKDWVKTKSYIRWMDRYIKSPKFTEKAQASPEKWMVVLYTSSENTTDQMTNFRCMLVRLLLQHHRVVYEERDVTLPQFRQDFQERLLGDKRNVPQVFMQGFSVGGYRVMYGIHRMKLTKDIFEKFVLSEEEYAHWMLKKDFKSVQLSLEVNLKAFPALQALAGSWMNDKLSPQHLEFVNKGKFVVKHALESWYQLSSQPYTEPDLRRYTLLRVTIIHIMFAMNKVYKQYLNKVDTDNVKMKRKLSWLPKFSKTPKESSV